MTGLLAAFALASLGCALVLLPVHAHGQRFDPNKYPWDQRPEHCFKSESGAPECAIDSWPTFDATAARVAGLFHTEQFHLLERALTEVTTSRKHFPSGYTPASAAYWAFRSLMNGGRFLPEDRERIARWKKAFPHSHFAVFAEARYLYANAWSIRGSGFAGSVSKESWELFNIRLVESERVLLQAPQKLKETPLWHQLMLAIVLDTRQTQTDLESAFTAAIKAWPRYFQYYEVILTRLTPKWGGSWRALETFIDHWSRQQATTEGDSMYARLYVSLIHGEGITPDQTMHNWTRMKKSFDELVARYPDPEFLNLYASYACAQRDKDAFGQVMRRLPSKMILHQVWIRGHSYDACLRWAGT
jgi:hypothetical protein